MQLTRISTAAVFAAALVFLGRAQADWTDGGALMAAGAVLLILDRTASDRDEMSAQESETVSVGPGPLGLEMTF